MRTFISCLLVGFLTLLFDEGDVAVIAVPDNEISVVAELLDFRHLLTAWTLHG